MRPLPWRIVVLVAAMIDSNIRICLHFWKLIPDVFDVVAVRVQSLVYIAVAQRSSLEYQKDDTARDTFCYCAIREFAHL